VGVQLDSKGETPNNELDPGPELRDDASPPRGAKPYSTDDVSGVNRVQREQPGPLQSDAGALLRDGARGASSRRDSMASLLLASARHELRSPLQSIQGFAELLGAEAYGSLSEEQHAFVEHILQGSLELGSVLEACLDLAQLQVESLPLERIVTDARSALTDALEHARKSSGTSLQTRYGNGVQAALLSVERDALRRALESLLTGLATGPSKIFRVDVTAELTFVKLLVSTPTRLGGPVTMSIDDFASRGRATKSLIWLRLAAELLLLQDAAVLMTEQLDCVEVRFQLSSTH